MKEQVKKLPDAHESDLGKSMDMAAATRPELQLRHGDTDKIKKVKTGER
jgi:hypothetical protein